MGTCRLCGRSHTTISDVIGVCAQCLRSRPSEALSIAKRAHERYRARLGLPVEPPRDGDAKCWLCVNECSIPRGSKGFCGLWINDGGRLQPIEGWNRAIVYWYLDPHPTNCVAEPVCPAATGRGYPEYALSPRGEVGYYNLAVFFAGCNLDCLFCQNWDHKEMIAVESVRKRFVRTVEELVEAAMDSRVTCVCYFGGDPGPHVIYAIKASREIARIAKEKRVLKRICWETNGLENPKIMEVMARLSIETGGIVKIDWKAWTPSVYQALTGVDGEKAVERLKENAKVVAKLGRDRPEPPPLVVSVLLVPGYVDAEEVENIAKYVASLDIDVPMVLLAFHPDHRLRDLPPTSRRHAYEALKAAKSAGVKEVYIGNAWLLGDYY